MLYYTTAEKNEREREVDMNEVWQSIMIVIKKGICILVGITL
jgi:hypothetical protein